ISWVSEEETYMSARILLILLLVVSFLYELMTMYIAAQQRKKPLPAEVADVYDADRYQKSLSAVADHRKAGLIVSAVHMAISTSLYLSGLYAHIERLTGNPYLIFFLTQAVFWIISTAVDVIDEKAVAARTNEPETGFTFRQG
ncbi:MAG: hypothetical protein IJH85_06045, partial [Clostridia bacterium]|nr:hypothetical protein [Clostridia bacterium]